MAQKHPAGLNSNARLSYFKTSAVFLFLSLLSAAINYLYYPVIARFLGVEEFGATQALIAIALQVSAIFAGLSLVTVYLVHKLPEQQSKRTIEILQKLTIGLFIIGAVLVAVFHAPIMKFLNIEHSTSLFLVSLNLLTSVPFIIAFGYLQARKRFVAAGCLQVVIVTIKLLFGPLLAVRFGVTGALAAIAIGQVVGMVVFWLACRAFKIPSWDHKITRSLVPPTLNELAYIRPELRNIIAIFIINVVMALFISFDLIAARHYFDASLSGLYAGASTVSNTIVFVALPLIGVLLPNLSTASLRQSSKNLARTLGLILLAAAGAITMFAIMPGFILSFFGDSYQSVDYLLVRLGIMMTLVSLITLVYQVCAFYRPTLTALFASAGFGGLLYFVSQHHNTPVQLISTISLVFATILLIGAVNLMWMYKND